MWLLHCTCSPSMAVWLSGSRMKNCLTAAPALATTRLQTTVTSDSCMAALIALDSTSTPSLVQDRASQQTSQHQFQLAVYSSRQHWLAVGSASVHAVGGLCQSPGIITATVPSHNINLPLAFSSITKHCRESRNIILEIISQNCVDSAPDAILIFTETTSEKLIIFDKRIHQPHGELSANNKLLFKVDKVCIYHHLQISGILYSRYLRFYASSE